MAKKKPVCFICEKPITDKHPEKFYCHGCGKYLHSDCDLRCMEHQGIGKHSEDVHLGCDRCSEQQDPEW